MLDAAPPRAAAAGPNHSFSTGKRKTLAWDADYKLQQGSGAPIIYHLRAATCWQPEVKGLTMMTNSQYNGWRFEDVWLDK